MDAYQSLSHTVWECKYHIVWIPKYRRKAVYGDLRKDLGTILRELAIQIFTDEKQGRSKIHDQGTVKCSPLLRIPLVVSMRKLQTKPNRLFVQIRTPSSRPQMITRYEFGFEFGCQLYITAE